MDSEFAELFFEINAIAVPHEFVVNPIVFDLVECVIVTAIELTLIAHGFDNRMQARHVFLVTVHVNGPTSAGKQAGSVIPQKPAAFVGIVIKPITMGFSILGDI